MIAGLGWQSCLSHHLSSLYEFMMVFYGLLVMAVCVCVCVCTRTQVYFLKEKRGTWGKNRGRRKMENREHEGKHSPGWLRTRAHASRDRTTSKG